MGRPQQPRKPPIAKPTRAQLTNRHIENIRMALNRLEQDRKPLANASEINARGESIESQRPKDSASNKGTGLTQKSLTSTMEKKYLDIFKHTRPKNAIKFYKDQNLPREIVIALENDRLDQGVKEGYNYPQWKREQIINGTLKALGMEK